MKNCLLKLAFALLFFIGKNIYAQSPSAHKQQLILEVSTVTSKNYDEVRNALSSLSGITLLAFCEQTRYFLLSYDPSVIASTDDIEKVVQQLHPSYKTKVITNMTVDELITNCTQYAASGSGTGISR